MPSSMQSCRSELEVRSNSHLRPEHDRLGCTFRPDFASWHHVGQDPFDLFCHQAQDPVYSHLALVLFGDCIVADISYRFRVMRVDIQLPPLRSTLPQLPDVGGHDDIEETSTMVSTVTPPEINGLPRHLDPRMLRVSPRTGAPPPHLQTAEVQHST